MARLCQAKTNKGRPCRVGVDPGDHFCGYHEPFADDGELHTYLRVGITLFGQLAALPDARAVHQRIATMTVDELRAVALERVYDRKCERLDGADFRRWQDGGER